MRKNMAVISMLAIAALIAQPLRAEDIDEQIEKYVELAKEGKDEAAAKKIGESILSSEKDADKLNEFAWRVLTEEGVKNRDVALGMRAAKAAYDACEGKSAAIVDTYARAFFESGNITEALKYQKKAVELCDDDNLKSELKETLERYEKKAAEKK